MWPSLRKLKAGLGCANLVIGFWPRHLAPYIAFAGPLPRGTQLLSGILPFPVLTVLPFLVALTVPATAWWMAGLSILNVMGSGADVVRVVLLARQVPAGALVRNQGYATWWCLRSDPDANLTTPCTASSDGDCA